MTFVSTFITYVIIFLVSMACAFAAVMIGKKLRDNKNEKTTESIPENKEE